MRQSPEVAEFDELGRLGVMAFELLQCLVERKKLLRPVVPGRFDVVEVEPLPFSPALECGLVPRPLNQDPPHRLGRGGEELTTTVPVLRLVVIHEPEVGLM